MRLLRADRALAASPGPDVPAAYAQATRAHAASMAGLHTWAARRLSASADALSKDPSQRAWHARVLAMGGMSARAAGDAQRASELLVLAFERLAEEGDTALAPLCLALAAEMMCAAGRVADARGLVERGTQRGTSFGDLANAFVKHAAGQYPEATQLAGLCAKEGRPPAVRTWASLLAAELHLDQSRPLAAQGVLAPVLEQLAAQGTLDEGYAHALVLYARSCVEALWIPGLDAGKDGPQKAKAALRQAKVYSRPFPRRRAWSLALHGQFGPRRTADERPLQAALALLEPLGLKLDQGRLLAQQVAYREATAHAPTKSLTARARDLLTKAGADGRSIALIPGDGRVEGASVALSRSMMSRSISQAALPGGGEEVELEAVFAVTRAISSELSLDALLQKILLEVVKVLKAERGAVLRTQPDGSLTCAAARGVDPNQVREGGDEISFSVVKEVQRTGTAVLTDNAQIDDRFRGRASVLATDVRSVICAPLKTQKGTLGFLYVDSTVKSRIFQDFHRELLGVFAGQAAAAIENAMAFGEVAALNESLERKVLERTAELASANQSLAASLEELRTTQLALLQAQKEALEASMNAAREIQERMVPDRSIHVRPGLKVVGQLDSAEQVGGDFWTCIPVDDKKSLVFVGDVVGHGLGAGMVTTVARACCDTLCRLQALSVERLLAVLSEVIREASRGTMTMTAFCMLVDPEARKLQFAAAAHPPPLVLEPNPSGPPKLAALMSRGSALGLNTGQSYTATTRPYQPGTRILLYTDGLIECTDAQQAQYGSRRARDAVLANAQKPLQEHLQAVMQDAYAFFGTTPRADDVTALLVELE